MVSRIPGHESFDWDIGTQSIPGGPIGLTYLFGIPGCEVPGGLTSWPTEPEQHESGPIRTRVVSATRPGPEALSWAS